MPTKTIKVKSNPPVDNRTKWIPVAPPYPDARQVDKSQKEFKK